MANVPTILVAYAFQTAFFPVYESLKEKNDKSGIIVAMSASLFCFFIYVVIALVALYMYGSEVKGNILEDVDLVGGALSTVLQVIFLLISAMHIPIVFFVGKEAVLIIVDEAMRKSIS